jgi:serine/threonine-protein kinase
LTFSNIIIRTSGSSAQEEYPVIGQKLGNYRIVEQVGVGRVTTVYKAHDPVTNAYVAIKILPRQYAQDPAIRAGFQRDADTIVTLEHPHILPVFAYGDENEFAYLAMPYLPAGTLKDRIRRGKLSLPEAAAILTQVAGALDYAHKRGSLPISCLTRRAASICPILP